MIVTNYLHLRNLVTLHNKFHYIQNAIFVYKKSNFLKKSIEILLVMKKECVYKFYEVQYNTHDTINACFD